MMSTDGHNALISIMYVILIIGLSVQCYAQQPLEEDSNETVIHQEAEEDPYLELLKSQHDNTFFPNNTEAEEELDKRIINGKNAPQNSFPWAASIKGVNPDTRATTYCGATFISNNWLVTAAHCFSGILGYPKYWHVQAGNVFIELGPGHSRNQKYLGPDKKDNHYKDDGTSKLYKLLNLLINGGPFGSFLHRHKRNHGEIIHAHPDKIVIHPKYQEHILEYDIALMHIPYSINAEKRDNVGIINLPEAKHRNTMPRPGLVCTIVGWGCVRRAGPPTRRAKLARLKVLKNSYCKEIYHHSAGINDKNEFCAGYFNGNIGICPGDSGSGLACREDGKWYISGVASATHHLKPSLYPGLFTRVAAYRKWIDSVTHISE